ncbi:type II toxin-antitoxin system RelE/ParE family toxin [Priestia megaterium]|uniref:type II toxin-antitoxin system RelE/ParE family toxin n=1 Tax=Priestia megaterium TaxID=1404 RepID=UPI002E1B8AFA|nr:type II toxin-antitoxin system RelE/ParE family toxin [Priestia megaterium]
MTSVLPYKLRKRAAKELKRIRESDKALYNKMNVAIQSIQRDPLIGGAKKGDLKGYFCLDVKHMGINYELCYTLEQDENGNIVVVVLMGPRENFYPTLKRYLGLL